MPGPATWSPRRRAAAWRRVRLPGTRSTACKPAPVAVRPAWPVGPAAAVRRRPPATTAGRYRPAPGPAPDNPWLAWAPAPGTHHGRARGWERDHAARHATHAGHAAGRLRRAASGSAPVGLPRRRSMAQAPASTRTMQLLAAMGILDDDRPTSLRPLAGRQARRPRPDESPTRQGAGRRAARRRPAPGAPHAQPTAYLTAVRPALLAWSAATTTCVRSPASDVRAYLDGAARPAAPHALTALRSLFTWAKTQRSDLPQPGGPAARRRGASDRRLAAAAPPTEIAGTIAAATTPHARLLVALAAVHAARPGQIRAMQLGDVDLGNRRHHHRRTRPARWTTSPTRS